MVYKNGTLRHYLVKATSLLITFLFVQKMTRNPKYGWLNSF